MWFETAVGNLGAAFGGSVLAGGVAGVAVKKLLKIALVVVGVQIAVVAYLDHRGMLAVQWQALDHAIVDVHRAVETLPAWFTTLGATVPIGAGFVGGFFLGFKNA